MKKQDAVIAVIFAVSIAFAGGWWIGKSKAQAEFETVSSLVPDTCRKALGEAALDFSAYGEPVQ